MALNLSTFHPHHATSENADAWATHSSTTANDPAGATVRIGLGAKDVGKSSLATRYDLSVPTTGLAITSRAIITRAMFSFTVSEQAITSDGLGHFSVGIDAGTGDWFDGGYSAAICPTRDDVPHFSDDNDVIHPGTMFGDTWIVGTILYAAATYTVGSAQFAGQGFPIFFGTNADRLQNLTSELNRWISRPAFADSQVICIGFDSRFVPPPGGDEFFGLYSSDAPAFPGVGFIIEWEELPSIITTKGFEAGPSVTDAGMESGASVTTVGTSAGPSLTTSGLRGIPSMEAFGIDAEPALSGGLITAGRSMTNRGLEADSSVSNFGIATEAETSISIEGFEAGASVVSSPLAAAPSISSKALEPGPAIESRLKMKEHDA